MSPKQRRKEKKDQGQAGKKGEEVLETMKIYVARIYAKASIKTISVSTIVHKLENLLAMEREAKQVSSIHGRDRELRSQGKTKRKTKNGYLLYLKACWK